MIAAAGDATDRAADAIRERLGSLRPAVLIVLGSGLGGLTRHIEVAARIPSHEIPGFPLPAVQGHRGELVAGMLGGRPVLAQSGRFHLYEGHEARTCALPVRACGRLGVETVILTNAAGGIRRTFRGGALMLIGDHVNVTFQNPLAGPLVPGDERFPDMSDPYDPSLRSLARDVARDRGIALEEGIYAGVLGPSYETPAEIRMLERIGADAVGMSTVVEVIAARARGMRCVGISTITNLAAGIGPAKLSHEEVMAAAHRMEGALGSLVEGIVARV